MLLSKMSISLLKSKSVKHSVVKNCHLFERFHDECGLALLVVGEGAGNDDNHGQDDAQVKIVLWRMLER